MKAIPWHKFFQRVPDDYIVLEAIPTTSVRNNQAYVLASIVSDWYRKPHELRQWGRSPLLTLADQHRVSFRIIMHHDSIRFLYLVPRAKAHEFTRKAEAVYDSNITIEIVEEALPVLNPATSACVEIGYRKHDMFSMATDKDNNYPLPSLLAAVSTLEEGDIAIFDALLEPSSRLAWYKEARQAHDQLEKGYVPSAGLTAGAWVFVHKLFSTLRDELLSLTRFTKEQTDEFVRWKQEESQYREAFLLKQEMGAATKRKQGQEVLKAWLRAGVQSSSPERARSTAYTIGNAWRDLAEDNTLDVIEVPASWTVRFISSIENRRPISVRSRADRMSVEEVGKVLQLPGRELIQEFPQIHARKHIEVEIPAELRQVGIKSIPLGVVTVRGKKVPVSIPLEAYPGVSTRAVYDAVCTDTLAQGKQGSGKTNTGKVMSLAMVKAGFSVILMDTADGQVLREFVDSLPADYPDDKLHLLDLDNKAWPIPLGWTDIYGRSFASAGGDDELAALEIQDRITSRLISFINGLSNTGILSDRMEQYLISCMRAITTSAEWDFLDLELALTSPSYRQELLARPAVQQMADVVHDLGTLQDRAIDGKEGAILDPILARLKTLSSTQFIANLFMQPPKFGKNGQPALDLRHIMDNPEGGYGHVVCIKASGDAWQAKQATILGFMLDKVNFNAFSRVDIPQDERKPCMVWIDEPHKIIRTIQKGLAGTSVEFRKYRVKNLFSAHSIDQMGAATDSLLDGGVQITSYKTERLSEFARYAHMFKPYDNPVEIYESLPDKWRAINTVRLPSGRTCPAFMADMAPPPKKVKDRSYAWQQSAERYGRPWKEVRDAMRRKREKYQILDNTWRELQNSKRKAR